MEPEKIETREIQLDMDFLAEFDVTEENLHWHNDAALEFLCEKLPSDRANWDEAIDEWGYDECRRPCDADVYEAAFAIDGINSSESVDKNFEQTGEQISGVTHFVRDYVKQWNELPEDQRPKNWKKLYIYEVNGDSISIVGSRVGIITLGEITNRKKSLENYRKVIVLNRDTPNKTTWHNELCVAKPEVAKPEKGEYRVATHLDIPELRAALNHHKCSDEELKAIAQGQEKNGETIVFIDIDGFQRLPITDREIVKMTFMDQNDPNLDSFRESINIPQKFKHNFARVPDVITLSVQPVKPADECASTEDGNKEAIWEMQKFLLKHADPLKLSKEGETIFALSKPEPETARDFLGALAIEFHKWQSTFLTIISQGDTGKTDDDYISPRFHRGKKLAESLSLEPELPSHVVFAGVVPPHRLDYEIGPGGIAFIVGERDPFEKALPAAGTFGRVLDAIFDRRCSVLEEYAPTLAAFSDGNGEDNDGQLDYTAHLEEAWARVEFLLEIEGAVGSDEDEEEEVPEIISVDRSIAQDEITQLRNGYLLSLTPLQKLRELGIEIEPRGEMFTDYEVLVLAVLTRGFLRFDPDVAAALGHDMESLQSSAQRLTQRGLAFYNEQTQTLNIPWYVRANFRDETEIDLGTDSWLQILKYFEVDFSDERTTTTTETRAFVSEDGHAKGTKEVIFTMTDTDYVDKLKEAKVETSAYERATCLPLHQVELAYIAARQLSILESFDAFQGTREAKLEKDERKQIRLECEPAPFVLALTEALQSAEITHGFLKSTLDLLSKRAASPRVKNGLLFQIKKMELEESRDKDKAKEMAEFIYNETQIPPQYLTPNHIRPLLLWSVRNKESDALALGDNGTRDDNLITRAIQRDGVIEAEELLELYKAYTEDLSGEGKARNVWERITTLLDRDEDLSEAEKQLAIRLIDHLSELGTPRTKEQIGKVEFTRDELSIPDCMRTSIRYPSSTNHIHTAVMAAKDAIPITGAESMARILVATIPSSFYDASYFYENSDQSENAKLIVAQRVINHASRALIFALETRNPRLTLNAINNYCYAMFEIHGLTGIPIPIKPSALARAVANFADDQIYRHIQGNEDVCLEVADTFINLELEFGDEKSARTAFTVLERCHKALPDQEERQKIIDAIGSSINEAFAE